MISGSTRHYSGLSQMRDMQSQVRGLSITCHPSIEQNRAREGDGGVKVLNVQILQKLNKNCSQYVNTFTNKTRVCV